MKAIITQWLYAAGAAMLALTSCGSGETYPMASAEGLAKIRELVAANVDTSQYKIYTVEWREDNRDRQLENILTYIDVYYLDADNNDYHLSFQLTNGKFTTDGPELNDRRSYSYACTTPLDIAAIDFDYLQKSANGQTLWLCPTRRQTPDPEVGRDVPFPDVAGGAEQRRPLEPQR